jgi:hypothetical protein
MHCVTSQGGLPKGKIFGGSLRFPRPLHPTEINALTPDFSMAASRISNIRSILSVLGTSRGSSTGLACKALGVCDDDRPEADVDRPLPALFFQETLQIVWRDIRLVLQKQEPCDLDVLQPICRFGDERGAPAVQKGNSEPIDDG